MKTAVGNIVKRPCQTRMVIYVPVKKSIQKAWVLFANGLHNHPMYSNVKPTPEDNKKLKEAIHASGSVVGLTVSWLMQGAAWGHTFSLRIHFILVSSKKSRARWQHCGQPT